VLKLSKNYYNDENNLEIAKPFISRIEKLT